MLAPSVLIAEMDPHALDVLPSLLSDHIADIVIDTCTTVDQLIRSWEGKSYDTVVVSPMLFHTYRFLTEKETPMGIPLLMTISQRDLPVAHTAFAGTAFDLIVKPIQAHDAAQTVRLALWHQKLQKLLALKQQAASRARPHRNASLQELKAEEDFLGILETTYQTLKTSFGLLLDIRQTSSLQDVAASVERRARRLVLDRLLNIYKEGLTH
jgi:DNA-binding NtrC family response regulator